MKEDAFDYKCLCPWCGYVSFHKDEHLSNLKECPECGEMMLRGIMKRGDSSANRRINKYWKSREFWSNKQGDYS